MELNIANEEGEQMRRIGFLGGGGAGERHLAFYALIMVMRLPSGQK